MEVNRNSFVLVYFHEEKRYSTLKLKDALKPADFEMVKDLKSWDRKKSLEIKWGHEMFPAYCLQFGGKFGYVIFKLSFVCHVLLSFILHFGKSSISCSVSFADKCIDVVIAIFRH